MRLIIFLTVMLAWVFASMWLVTAYLPVISLFGLTTFIWLWAGVTGYGIYKAIERYL